MRLLKYCQINSNKKSRNLQLNNKNNKRKRIRLNKYRRKYNKNLRYLKGKNNKNK